jgi:hypothetical protein
MTLTAVLSTLAVVLALLLISAAWAARTPAWQIVFGPPEDSPNRMPLTEFCVEARNRGWDFAADEQLLPDLTTGLREAALAGSIEIWGRKCRTMTLLRSPDEPLVRIPATFWKHHDLDGLDMAIADNSDGNAGAHEGAATKNALIQTRAIPTSEPDFEDAAYRDIHLNYMQAMDWLQTDAGSYKGLSRRGN